MRIKLIKVDRHAQLKGFRKGQVHIVKALDPYANAARGILFWVTNRQGRSEGFYRDEFRMKPRRNLHCGYPKCDAKWVDKIKTGDQESE